MAIHGDDCVVLHTDGSWRCGDDRMGGGGVIRDQLGRWVSGFATFLEACSAWQAEVVAIRKGLTHTCLGVGVPIGGMLC